MRMLVVYIDSLLNQLRQIALLVTQVQIIKLKWRCEEIHTQIWK